jgi:hypothetical protein
MENGIKGTHIATGYPCCIELTPREMELATCNDICMNECWDKMNDSVFLRTGEVIIDQVEIDTITVNGVVKNFH